MNSENQKSERVDLRDARITQLETALITSLPFDSLIARLVSDPVTKKVRTPRAKLIWTPKEKASFHARMVALKLGIENPRTASKK